MLCSFMLDALVYSPAAYHRHWQEQNKRSPARVSFRLALMHAVDLRTTSQRLDRLAMDNHALH